MLEKHFKMLDYKDFFLLDYSLTKQEWEIVIHLAHKDKWKMYQYHKKKPTDVVVVRVHTPGILHHGEGLHVSGFGTKV